MIKIVKIPIILFYSFLCILFFSILFFSILSYFSILFYVSTWIRSPELTRQAPPARRPNNSHRWTKKRRWERVRGLEEGRLEADKCTILQFIFILAPASSFTDSDPSRPRIKMIGSRFTSPVYMKNFTHLKPEIL